ncbi:MAG: TrmH family RNA methyltransferase [Phycisphaerales bacterium]
MIEIHDPKDPRIGVFLNQKDAWLKAAHNPDGVIVSGDDPDDHSDSQSGEGCFIAEGVLVVEQLIKSHFAIQSVLVSENRAKNINGVLETVPEGAPIYVAKQSILDEIVGFPMHRGLLACGRRKPNLEPIELAKSCRALVVLEDLSNHDNVGSVFRSVAAMGGDGVGVWLTRKCCDPLYRKALRVSMGHVLRVPYAVVDDLPQAMASLSPLGYTTIAFTPDNQSKVLGAASRNDSPEVGVDRPALLFGAEGPGLSDAALEAAEQCVRIEMTKNVDSLNIAVSAAVGIHRYITPA